MQAIKQEISKYMLRKDNIILVRKYSIVLMISSSIMVVIQYLKTNMRNIILRNLLFILVLNQ
ncbi:unnamed protein product [Schistosoma curassoni]|uniref:ABC transporter permease n=1 Tax=Schistosoma curassoni TaxID=6186 RepID=A0A183JF11_9TREM|nr:unnamed protein product [Schistosoma curassoni]